MKTKRALSIFFLILFIINLLLCSNILAIAHSGRTDSNGGHYNRSTGEYHYHHGMPAHQHESGLCPYDFDSNKEYKSAVKENQKLKTKIFIITIAVITGLVLLHIFTKGGSTDFIFHALYILMFLPFFIIYYIFVAISFIIKKILFALPCKAPYNHKILERYWIDIDKINRRFELYSSEDKFLDKLEYCKLVAESDKYYFYSYRTYRDGSGGYILRREKKQRDRIVYFGEAKKFNIVFNDYLFQVNASCEIGRSHIVAKGIDNGYVLKFDWLSKTPMCYTINNFLRYYSQDSVSDVFIRNDNLIFKISRKQSNSKDRDISNPYDKNLDYELVVTYENGSFKAKGIMTPIDNNEN